METVETTEKRLLAEIEALRLQYPDTQDLYREVCVILFFRHGITPTANKLYQLVRKGSMSAPADALNRFWEMLREGYDSFELTKIPPKVDFCEKKYVFNRVAESGSFNVSAQRGRHCGNK